MKAGLRKLLEQFGWAQILNVDHFDTYERDKDVCPHSSSMKRRSRKPGELLTFWPLETSKREMLRESAMINSREEVLQPLKGCMDS